MVKYARVKETDSGPSCSLAEALERQDLFINSTLAQLGCGILWKMFRNGVIEHNGLYLNLDTMKVNPIISYKFFRLNGKSSGNSLSILSFPFSIWQDILCIGSDTPFQVFTQYTERGLLLYHK